MDFENRLTKIKHTGERPRETNDSLTRQTERNQLETKDVLTPQGHLSMWSTPVDRT